MKCPICDVDIPLPTIKNFSQCIKCGLYINTDVYFNSKSRYANVIAGSCIDKEKEKKKIDNSNRQLIIIEKWIDKGYLFDCGAGGGVTLKVAKDRGWKVDGCEVGYTLTKAVKDLYDINIQYGDLIEVDIKDNFYNCIIVDNVLEHIVDLDSNLSKIKSMLTEKGILFIEVPTKENISKEYEEWHTYEFNSKNIVLLLEKYNFEIVEFIDYNSCVNIFCRNLS